MKLIKIIGLCLFLSGCGDNPFNDTSKIEDTDYSQIRLEIERCSHIANEGSFIAIMRWSPKNDCLKHLKTRIITTGKAINYKDGM